MHEHAEMYCYVPVVHDGMCVFAGSCCHEFRHTQKYYRFCEKSRAARMRTRPHPKYVTTSNSFLRFRIYIYISGTLPQWRGTKQKRQQKRSTSTPAKNEWVNECDACMWKFVLRHTDDGDGRSQKQNRETKKKDLQRSTDTLRTNLILICWMLCAPYLTRLKRSLIALLH